MMYIYIYLEYEYDELLAVGEYAVVQGRLPRAVHLVCK